MKSLLSLLLRLIQKLLSLFRSKKPAAIAKKQKAQEVTEVTETYGTIDHDADKRPAPQTYKEAHDRSWEFLYKIVDYIQKKFSKPDLTQVVNIGSALFNSGMVYVHQVVFNPEAAEKARQERIIATATPGQKKQDSGR